MKNDFSTYEWINQPENFSLQDDRVIIKTEPYTDFWQRTYYGFRRSNGHVFAFPTEITEFTYSLATTFTPEELFDQCGVIIYLDEDNWFKASIEYHTESFSRLGSVVTNLGYSDWATTDIYPPREIKMGYRLSRRNDDFLIESSQDGEGYRQMRIFHLHHSQKQIKVGLYACSPLDSSFTADFQNIQFGPCLWEPYKG